MSNNNNILISIIVVNYNTSEHLIKCLESAFDITSDVETEIIVVDNNSTDESIEKLNEIFPNVKLILRNVNDGFGGGCNEGAKYAKGKYLVFANPDTIIKDNVFASMMNYMEKNKDVGMCSSSFYDFEGNIRHTFGDFPGIYSEFLEAMGRGTNERLNKFLRSKELKLGKPFEVDWITGAFMFFNKNCFDEIGGFDTNYFLYYEDVDIQYRLKNAGYRIICLPNIKVYHSSNASVKSEKGEDIYYYNLHRSKMIYCYKHFNFYKRNFIRIIQIIGVFFRISILYVRASFKGKKEQKMNQYKKMLSIYFSSKEKLFESTGLL